MKCLFDILKTEPDYARLLKSVQNGELPIAANGLSQVHKAVVLSAINKQAGKKLFVITHDEPSAISMQEDFVGLGLEALVLQSRDYNLTRMAGYSKEYEHKRIHTLSRILDGAFDVVVIPVDAAVQHTVPPSVLKKNIINIAVGDCYRMTDLCAALIEAVYTRSELCDGVGQFAARGGILDVFATGSDAPVRIEFWGDEVDNISYYDVESQRRTDSAEDIKIFPANELPFNAAELSKKLEQYLVGCAYNRVDIKNAIGNLEVCDDILTMI